MAEQHQGRGGAVGVCVCVHPSLGEAAPDEGEEERK